MKITVDAVAPTPGGIRLGLRVEGDKHAWLRFSTAVLLVEDLSLVERQWIVKALDQAVEDTQARVSEEQLPLDWS